MEWSQKDSFKSETAKAGYSMAEAVNYLVAAFLTGKIKLPVKKA